MAQDDQGQEIESGNGAPKDSRSQSEFAPWTPDGHTRVDHYKFAVNGISPMGNKIQRIFGISRDYLVWLDEKDNLCFDFNDPLPDYMRPALNEFRRLRSVVPILLSTKGERDLARQLLAAGLCHVFHSKSEAEASAGFTQARAFIETRAEEPAKSNYLMITAAASVGVFVALFVLRGHDTLLQKFVTPESLRQIALGGMAGIVGASMSLVQRSDAIRIDPFSRWWYKAFDGILRALLGAIFGMIVVIAAKAQIAFTIATNSPYALFMLSLVGGFSERMVPNLIARLAREQEDQDDQKNKGAKG